MEIENRSTLERSDTRIWELEEYTQTFFKVEKKGMWDKILEALNMTSIMIDSTCTKCHVHLCGARGGKIQKSM